MNTREKGDMAEHFVSEYFSAREYACEIIFPVIVHSTQNPILDEETRKWLEATVNLLDKFYPRDIFTGESGDKGALAIKALRENLEVKE